MSNRKKSLVPKPERRTDTPKYMTSSHVEYLIVKTESGMWKIVMYKGGFTPKPLRGMFTHHSLAEKTLISWLKKNDKFREAIYPGCEPKRLSYIARSSKD